METYQPYLALTKPRLMLLALATALLGFFMASYTYARPEPLKTALLLGTLLACALIGGGINALNQYLERGIDAKMKRTENRPLPAGRIRPKQALVFGVVLTAAGLACLLVFTNRLAFFLGLLTALSYLFLYTPLKARTPLNTLAGALPGALPCLIGWTAFRGSLSAEAWSIFLILFFWQLPHFFAIAWVYRDDYKKGGLRMLTRNDPDGQSTGKKIVLTSLALLPFTLYPVWLGLGGMLYLAAALISGVYFISEALRLSDGRMAEAKKFVSLSIYYLMVLIFSMMADKII